MGVGDAVSNTKNLEKAAEGTRDLGHTLITRLKNQSPASVFSVGVCDRCKSYLRGERICILSYVINW